jgi:hypothetical protein
MVMFVKIRRTSLRSWRQEPFEEGHLDKDRTLEYETELVFA